MTPYEPVQQGRSVTLALCGDVMTGRGVDQILPHPGDPRISEAYIRDAREYVRLAEAEHGPVPRAVGPEYIWGDVLKSLDAASPAARLVNLETAITARGGPWPGKEVHYRMHPANLPCLKAAKLDLAILANNHAMDYGREGLADTLAALQGAGIRTAGAGASVVGAFSPTPVPLRGGGTLEVFAYGSPTSGVPESWAASGEGSGVAFLPDLSLHTADALLEDIQAAKQPGKLVLVSLHWGSNWGYEVPAEQVTFARRLIDGGADLIFGHSSHHVRPMEVHRDRLILYGCGDFIDDYEGIGGDTSFRDDLRVLFLPSLDPATGALRHLRMLPFAARRLRLARASAEDAAWLAQTLTRVCSPFNRRVEVRDTWELHLH
ncbi:MAG TPA: CapA family protein [Holophagaceae bacterium]|nr:CapA family protein [Holophagaceae bacterium]